MVTGRALHQGTGQPVRGTIAFSSPSGPIIANVRPDGSFAISGRPDLLFPDLATQNYAFQIELTATSTQFRAGSGTTGATVNLTAGEDFSPPLDAGTLEFPADPVYIRGTVTNGAEPFGAIVGATVQLFQDGVLQDSAVTDADGAYAFDAVIVPAPAELVCSAATYTAQTRTLLLDYGLAVNQEFFRMTPI